MHNLFNAVMEEDLERQLRITEEVLATHTSVERGLLDLLGRAYQFHLGQLPLLQAATGLSWSHGLTGPFGNRPVYGPAVDTMKTILQRGVASGELKASTNIELIAEMTWVAYLANYRRAMFDGWDLDALVARLTEQIEVLLAGARVSAPPA